MKTLVMIVLIFLATILMIGCAPEANIVVGIPTADGNIADFWLGLWHGFIIPITFIISLFSKNTNIYEVQNNGGGYNFGFMIGAFLIAVIIATWPKYFSDISKEDEERERLGR